MTTTEVSTISDLDLELAITEAFGFQVCRTGETCLIAVTAGQPLSAPHWHREPRQYWSIYPPPYATSIDRLGEVEARLREAGWSMTVESPPGLWSVEWDSPTGAVQWANADTEARARAEACLLALQALNSPTKEIA